jgi:hypothetical protein
MSVQAVFRAHTTLLDPTGREGLLLGYKDVQGLRGHPGCRVINIGCGWEGSL